MEMIRLKSLLESLIFVSEIPLKTGEMLKAVHALQRLEAREAFGSEAEGDPSEDFSADDEEDPSVSQEERDSLDAADQLQSFAEAEEKKISNSDIQKALRELEQEYLEEGKRGILLVEVSNGWQFRTRPENAKVIKNFYQPKPTRLSKPSMETLSIVAYRQPITRAEIDEIRGVDSGGVLKTLCEKNLVRIVGKKNEPGKPLLYGTTTDFLELFQLKNLNELPDLRDYRDLEEEFRRKSGEEGTVLETDGEEAEEERSILELSSEHELMPLDEEEEEVLNSLEENIKGVRKLEREIFPKENPPPSTEAEGESTVPPNEGTPGPE